MTGRTPGERVRLRPRRQSDLAALVEVLAGQQPTTGYPELWPLPFDPVELIQRPDEVTALVAELDGRPVGHVSVQRAAEPERGTTEDPEVLWMAAHKCGLGELGVVSALFVADDLRGTGVGGRLLDAAVAAIREAGLRPCLDVVAGRSPAATIYERRGWVTVGECRPTWATDVFPPVLAMILPVEL